MELLIKFTDQSESFTYGVEFGRLLEKLERGDEAVKNKGFPVRIENVENLRDACVAFNYIPWFSKPILDGWVDFMAIKSTISFS